MSRGRINTDIANELAEKIMDLVKPHKPVNALCALEIAMATASICSAKTHRDALATLSESTEVVMELIDTFAEVHWCHWEKEH